MSLSREEGEEEEKRMMLKRRNHEGWSHNQRHELVREGLNQERVALAALGAGGGAGNLHHHQ